MELSVGAGVGLSGVGALVAARDGRLSNGLILVHNQETFSGKGGAGGRAPCRGIGVSSENFPFFDTRRENGHD